MESAFIILVVLLALFAILAVYDGFYLHIFKYELHTRKESKPEHFTHTIRALIFPVMIFFLFVIQDCTICFYIGLTLVFIDVVVMAIDAYMEKDSRAFMGGLPRWEYMLHLFVNGFHFATIAVYLVLKVQLNQDGLTIVPNFYDYQNFRIFQIFSINLIPGAILMALLHVFVAFPATEKVWHSFRQKMRCCNLQF